MTDLTRLRELLGEHRWDYVVHSDFDGYGYSCLCGERFDFPYPEDNAIKPPEVRATFDAHLAEVIDQHYAEQRAGDWDAGYREARFDWSVGSSTPRNPHRGGLR